MWITTRRLEQVVRDPYLAVRMGLPYNYAVAVLRNARKRQKDTGIEVIRHKIPDNVLKPKINVPLRKAIRKEAKRLQLNKFVSLPKI